MSWVRAILLNKKGTPLHPQATSYRRDWRRIRRPGWDTVPHTSQFLPRFMVSLRATNILAQAALHRRVETSNRSALRDFGISRGCACPCPPTPTPLRGKNTSAKDENQLLLPLAAALPQPQETEGAFLHQAHSAGSASNECGQRE